MKIGLIMLCFWNNVGFGSYAGGGEGGRKVQFETSVLETGQVVINNAYVELA